MNRKLFWLSIVVAFIGVVYCCLSTWIVSVKLPPFNSTKTIYVYRQFDNQRYADIPNLIDYTVEGVEQLSTSSLIENPEKYNLVLYSQKPYHSDVSILLSALLVVSLSGYIVILIMDDKF